MKVQFAEFSCKGPRATNQDRVLAPIQVRGGFLMAVADGVGGAPGGELAAEIAVNTLRRIQWNSADFTQAFAEIVAAIRTEADANPEFENMATTCSVAMLREHEITIGHVGDARIYHLRGGGIVTLSQDQTEVAELVRKGILTGAQARKHPRRNTLTSALSALGDYKLFTKTADVEKGDRFVLLTDGIYRKVPRQRIAGLSLENVAVSAFLESLRMHVENASPSDNYTALAVEVA